MLENYISVNKILKYCENAAKNCEELAEKCIKSTGKGENQTSSLGGAAYFLQKSEMYRYYIPNILKNIEHKKFDIK